MDTLGIAKKAFLCHKALHDLTDYRGILSLQAYARLALISQNEEMLAHCRMALLPFVRGELGCPA